VVVCKSAFAAVGHTTEHKHFILSKDFVFSITHNKLTKYLSSVVNLNAATALSLMSTLHCC